MHGNCQITEEFLEIIVIAVKIDLEKMMATVDMMNMTDVKTRRESLEDMEMTIVIDTKIGPLQDMKMIDTGTITMAEIEMFE